METEKLLKVVETLGKEVFEGANINQLARLSGVNVATMHRMLKEMEKENLVLKEKKGNNVFYRPKLKNSSMLKYCELSSIERRKKFLLKHPGFYEKIRALESIADCAVLFGSLARNEKGPGDVDVLLLYNKQRDIKAMEAVARNLKISPLYMEFSEFTEKLGDRNRVLLEIVRDGIVLFKENIYWGSVKEALHERD